MRSPSSRLSFAIVECFFLLRWEEWAVVGDTYIYIYIYINRGSVGSQLITDHDHGLEVS